MVRRSLLSVQSLAEVLSQVEETFARHPVAEGKELHVQGLDLANRLRTDVALLQRVLTNMVKNAFEATGPGGPVRLWCEADGKEAAFGVWNRQAMPDDVAMRVFQRYFSTKDEPGRGLGTYSMKLLGEQYLQGRVEFQTSAEDGTTFTLTIPRRLPPGGAEDSQNVAALTPEPESRYSPA